MPDSIAMIRIPPGAAGYREALSGMAHFRVEDMGDAIAGIAPAEGAGGEVKHFDLHKLCDAQSDLEDPATWLALRRHAPARVTSEDPVAFRDRMIALGDDVRARRGGMEGELVAFNLAAMGAAQLGELPELLAGNLANLFGQFPGGSLWLASVSDVLLARLAFGRAQFAFQLSPDMPLGPDMEQLKAVTGLGLGGGADFQSVMRVALLALSPAALGLMIPAMPQVLIFLFGDGVDLRQTVPVSFAAMNRPNALADPHGVAEVALLKGLAHADGEELLHWWVARLNRLYSHASDPTRFTDATGFHDGAAQMAWMVTLERLIGDALALLAEPQASDLQRVQTAFDLLDKAEALLGFGEGSAGHGFMALLRRKQAMPRLREAYQSLPDDLALRLGDSADRLFDEMYADVRANTLQYRLTPKGIKVAQSDPAVLKNLDDDSFIATLVRGVRNSSHGLLSLLSEHREKFLMAINTGDIPAELPALAPLLALGLLADPDGLIDGSWRRKLTGG